MHCHRRSRSFREHLESELVLEWAWVLVSVWVLALELALELELDSVLDLKRGPLRQRHHMGRR
jgi:hypothetical protein